MNKTSIHQKRLEAGLSQEVLARRALISRQFLGLIERDASAPTVYVAIRLARVLGCKVEDLFEAE